MPRENELPEDVQKYTAEYEAKLKSVKTFRGARPEVMFKKGARFFKDETTGHTMFAFKLDVNNEHIARASDNHKDEYPKEWMDYVRSQKGVKKS
jgi:hypothetical protein